MSEQNHVYESDVMALPPLRLVLGDVPSPDPETRRKPLRQPTRNNREMEIMVRRIITHLIENEK